MYIHANDLSCTMYSDIQPLPTSCICTCTVQLYIIFSRGFKTGKKHVCGILEEYVIHTISIPYSIHAHVCVYIKHCTVCGIDSTCAFTYMYKYTIIIVYVYTFMSQN